MPEGKGVEVNKSERKKGRVFRRFHWWFKLLLMSCRLMAVSPLAMIAAAGLLVQVHDKTWLFYLLWVILLFYVPAEMIEAAASVSEHWKTRASVHD
jgi:hypothetical protein